MGTICNICKKLKDDLVKTGVRSYLCATCLELKNAGKTLCTMCSTVKPETDFVITKGRPFTYCKKCYYPVVRRLCKENGYDNGSLKYIRKVRAAVREGYGNKCACCGETEPEFMTLDHVHGGGAKHRKGNPFIHYVDAYKRNYPADYQLLCYNCNCVKSKGATCPHELERMAAAA